MQIILFGTSNRSSLAEFESLLHTRIPALEIELHCSFVSLVKAIRSVNSHQAVAILMVDKPIELAELLTIQDYLSDLRLILILPDNDQSTISVGHKLYPRYMTSRPVDFKEVTAVVEKMLNIDCKKVRTLCMN